MGKFSQLDLDMYYENLRDNDQDESDPPVENLIDELEYNTDFLQEYEDYLITSKKDDTVITYKEFGLQWLIKKGIIYG